MSDPQELLELVKRLAEIQDDRARIDAEEKAIKAEILAAVDQEPDRYQVGDICLDVQVNRRFNETKALAAIPAEIVNLVTEPTRKVDRKKLEVLLPQVFEQSWDVHAPRVVIR